MPAIYTYPVSATATGQVDPDLLLAELSDAIPAHSLLQVSALAGTITITWDASLTAAEQTTQDGVVADHEPEAAFGEDLEMVVPGEVTANSGTWVSIAEVTLPSAAYIFAVASTGCWSQGGGDAAVRLVVNPRGTPEILAEGGTGDSKVRRQHLEGRHTCGMDDVVAVQISRDGGLSGRAVAKHTILRVKARGA